MSDKDKLAPSSRLVPVEVIYPEVRPGAGAMLLMKDGTMRAIMKTSAVNFDMKSPMEQSGIARAFGALAESLEYPIEISVHSKRLDIERYQRQYVAKLANPQLHPAKRALIESHVNHFQAIAQQHNLLQREFYITIPHRPNVTDELVAQQKRPTDDLPFASLWAGLVRAAERKENKASLISDDVLILARQQLEIRCDEIQRKLRGSGIDSRPLDVDEIQALLYEYFNPAEAERRGAPKGRADGGPLGFSAYGKPAGRREPLVDIPEAGPQF